MINLSFLLSFQTTMVDHRSPESPDLLYYKIYNGTAQNVSLKIYF